LNLSLFKETVPKTNIYQCSIHGAIEFPGNKSRLNELVKSLIDTPEMQRLRHIRQNGLAAMVFSSMEHTRLAHSLGVAYVARRMVDRIGLNSEIERTELLPIKLHTVAAALLHDLGHGPFSHTFEEVLKDPTKPFSHEKMTLRILEEDSKVSQVLRNFETDLPVQIAKYIAKGRRSETGEHWKYRLVSSQMDADRLDYVLRDAKMAGLNGTTYDLERILQHVHVHPTKPESIAVSRHATEAVESFLLALDQLYRIVYYHQAVRAATVLLKSALRRAVQLHSEAPQVANIFPARLNGNPHPLSLLIEKGESIELFDYLRLTDSSIWALLDLWRDHRDPILKDLCDRLWTRNLSKAIPIKDSEHGSKIFEQAIELSQQNISIVNSRKDAEFYVTMDVSRRKTYKPEDAIWLSDDNAKEAKTLQEDDSSRIIQVVREQHKIEFLMVPAEIEKSLFIK
jgi:uncharacterized protein